MIQLRTQELHCAEFFFFMAEHSQVKISLDRVSSEVLNYV